MDFSGSSPASFGSGPVGDLPLHHLGCWLSMKDGLDHHINPLVVV
jgi:hypothetical protein